MVSYTDIMARNDVKITCCPHCSSISFIKYGRYKNIPRFKCKDCLRTFSTRTNTPWYYSKKTPAQWQEFCFLLMDCRTLEYCAKALKINIATAFYWRHKILTALKSNTEPDILSNHVIMHHYFIKESFKGSKTIVHEPETRAKLWVIMSYDSCDNSLTMPYCKRSWNKSRFEELVYSKIDPKTYISAFGNRYIQVYANNHNKRLRKPMNSMPETQISALIYIFREILRKTRGIATKYLLEYFTLVKIHFLKKRFNISGILHDIYTNSYIKSHNIKKLTSMKSQNFT